MQSPESNEHKGNSVTITYDLLQATAEQIEEKLTGIGLQLGECLAGSLQAFAHYEEDCVIGADTKWNHNELQTRRMERS